MFGQYSLLLKTVCLRGCLALLMCAPLCAMAATELPAHLVCYDDVFVPYVMPQGSASAGLNVDVLREAGRRLGVAIEFRQMPWKRIETELTRGAIDCAFAMSKTPERERVLQFGNIPLHETRYQLFVRCGASQIHSLDELEGKSIGVRAGFRLPETVAAGVAAGRWRVAEVNEDSVNFRKLVLGRVDGVITESNVGKFILRQLQADSVCMIAAPLARFDTFLVFSKGGQSAVLAGAFDRALDDMARDGTTARIEAVLPAP